MYTIIYIRVCVTSYVIIYMCIPLCSPFSARPCHKLPMPRNQVLLRPHGRALHIAHVQHSSQLSLRKLVEPRIFKPEHNLLRGVPGDSCPISDLFPVPRRIWDEIRTNHEGPQ